ncbi:MAG: LPS assembly protein LptD [bacterium]|nr:LPS assembly protein LptD [bacterium]
MNRPLVTIFFLLICFTSLAFAADVPQLVAPAPVDTNKTKPVILDTLLVDTLKLDSLKTDSLQKKSELDTVVNYTADNIRLHAKSKVTELIGKAHVFHKGMDLTAHKIIVDWDRNMVFAEGRPDTLWMVTTMTQVDTIIFVETPLFLDRSSGNGDSLRGYKMELNLETKKGRVFVGKTAIEQGRYRGSVMKRVEEQVLFVKDGDFTTCDSDEPHYHFHSKRMKILYRDKLIAQPVMLYFGDIPTMIVPYGIFSLKPGRHSGLVVPSYGESTNEGRYFKHLGYYWAPNDYWDTKTTFDFYEKYGTVWNLNNNYAVRYKLNGYLNGSFINQHKDESRTQRWVGSWGHSHDIDPTQRIRADVNYVSDATYYKDFSNNLDERLTAEARSNISYYKNWPDTRASISANLAGVKNLNNSDYNITYPQFNFRWNDGPLLNKTKKNVVTSFGGPPRVGEGSTPEQIKSPSDETPFLETVTYGYNLAVSNREFGVNRERSDSTKYLEITVNQGAQHTFNMSAPKKVFKHFNTNTGFRVTHDWAPRVTKFSLNDSSQVDSVQQLYIDSEQDRGFFTRTTFSLSTGIGTKFYGMMDPKGAFGLSGVRHVVTPNLSFSYTPDFTDRKFGYVKRFQDPVTGQDLQFGTGYYRTQYFDPWAGTTAGSTPRGKTLSAGFSVNNLFQGKYEEGEESKKIDLFTWDLSTAYNFAADSLKWSNLTMSGRASPYSSGKGLISSVSFDLSTQHSFYQYHYSDPSRKIGTVIDKFYWERAESFPKLLRYVYGNANISLRWQKPQPQVEETKEDSAAAVERLANEGVLGIPDDVLAQQNDPYLSGGLVTGSSDRPQVAPPQSKWEGSTSLILSYNVPDPLTHLKEARLVNTINLSLTPTWNIGYGATIDLITRKVLVGTISTRKDLHCWEAMLTWNPQGIGEGFYLRINVKSADLQDLKVERKKGRGGIG